MGSESHLRMCDATINQDNAHDIKQHLSYSIIKLCIWGGGGVVSNDIIQLPNCIVGSTHWTTAAQLLIILLHDYFFHVVVVVNILRPTYHHCCQADSPPFPFKGSVATDSSSLATDSIASSSAF